MVLDAAVDPDPDQIAHAEAQAAGFEAAFDAFAADCRELVADCPVSEDPRRFLQAVLDQAAAEPIPSAEEGETRQATPGVVMTAVVAALYDTGSWPQLAQGLAAARKGDSQDLFSLADSYSGRLDDGRYSNFFDANIAVSCADSEETVPEERVRALVAEWGAEYPLFGASSAVSLHTCSVWDAPRNPLPERDAGGSDPILVIGTEGDPATPLEGAVDLAEQLEDGRLVTWQGDGHTAYPKTDCVTAAVNTYLLEATPPLDGLTCPA